MLAHAETVARKAARGLAVAGLLLLLLLAVATLADGVLRFFFGRPIDAVRDLNGVVVALAAASCIPLAMTERSNITIRFVSVFFGRRVGRVADIGAGILVCITLAAMAGQFFVFANQARRSGDITWVLGVPTAPFWFAVAALMGISMICQFLVLARDVVGVEQAGAQRSVLEEARP